jgi:hypothetical protein
MTRASARPAAPQGRVSGALWRAFMILAACALGVPLLLVLSLALVLCTVAVVLSTVFVILYVIFQITALFPAYSAEFYIKERDTTVTLEFYRIWRADGPMDNEEDGSRSVTVRTPDGEVTHKICGDDWGRRPRTSLYLVGDHALAIVGPYSCDYLISTRPMAVSRVVEDRSRDWIYLGAFDLVDDDGPPRRRVLQFIPAGQEQECIEGTAQRLTVRNEARRDSCSSIRHRR